jgi:hypothetical protein
MRMCQYMDIMMALLKIINNLVDVLKLDEPILENYWTE